MLLVLEMTVRSSVGVLGGGTVRGASKVLLPTSSTAYEHRYIKICPFTRNPLSSKNFSRYMLLLSCTFLLQYHI